MVSHVQSLGYKVNMKKSNLELRQQAVLVGLSLDSITMTGSLTPQRVMKLLALLDQLRLGRQLELV